MEKPKPIRLLLFLRMLKDLQKNNQIIFRIGEQIYYLECADFRFYDAIIEDVKTGKQYKLDNMEQFETPNSQMN